MAQYLEATLNDFALYRTIAAGVTDAVADATFAAAVDKRNCQGAENVIVSAFFRASGDTMVFQANWYDEDDALISISAPVTLTPLTSTTKVVASNPHFAAPQEFLANPGATYCRVKITTPPAANTVSVFFGVRQ
jgi:hypothetical protein